MAQPSIAQIRSKRDFRKPFPRRAARPGSTPRHGNLIDTQRGWGPIFKDGYEVR